VTRALCLGWAGLLCVASCAASLSDHVVVRRVVDGDTVELTDGRLVRYIGIDTPEVRRKEHERWIVDPEPMAEEASAFNRQLVEGKEVRLEYDVQSYDRFGRVLAYVYVGDVMVNAQLLMDGYAQPLTIPPNVKHATWFRTLAQQARQAGRGLWKDGGKRLR